MERAVYFILRADFLLLGVLWPYYFSFGWVEFVLHDGSGACSWHCYQHTWLCRHTFVDGCSPLIWGISNISFFPSRFCVVHLFSFIDQHLKE